MPSLADMQAAIPRCDRLTGAPGSDRHSCLRPLRWSGQYPLVGESYGSWVCPKHGPMMSGADAALRAGYISMISVDREAA